MSDSNDRYHNMTSDTDFSPRSSEESPRSPDSSQEPSPSRVQEEKRETSSSQSKDDASDRHSERSGSRQRRMSLDSVSTEGSASVVSAFLSSLHP